MAANVAHRMRCAFKRRRKKTLANCWQQWERHTERDRKLAHKSWGNSRYNRSKMKWHHVVEICCFPFSFSFCYPYLIVIPLLESCVPLGVCVCSMHAHFSNVGVCVYIIYMAAWYSFAFCSSISPKYVR